MYLLDEPEGTDVKLTVDDLQKYVREWEQVYKLMYKRRERDFEPVSLDKLGQHRSSRWYSSFRLDITERRDY